jgi:PAS domain S-box-containing protein
MTRSIEVLHVDDDPGFTSLSADVLEREREGIAVTTASRADEALDRLEAGTVDCVVSDYDMPGRNGIEFLERVRADHPDLPFILFTGKGSEEVASDAFSAGATDYLQKEGGTDQFTILANRIENYVGTARAARERERHLDAIETAQEGISILDQNGEFTYVNEAYAALYGYEPEAMLGEHWELIYPEGSIERAREEIIPAVFESGDWHGQTMGLRADGSTFVEDHTLSTTGNGELICTVRDVTDREARKQDLDRYRTVVEALGDPIYTVDDEGRYTFVNDAYAEMTGYDKDEILGKHVSFLLDEASIERGMAGIREIIETDTDKVTYPTTVKTADGERISCEARLSLLPPADGTYQGSAGVVRDVSEREAREAELAETNTLLRAILEHLPMGVLVEDTDREIRAVNERLCTVLGVDTEPESLVGRDCGAAARDIKDLFADPDGFLADIEATIEAGERVRGEELALADGRTLQRECVPYESPAGEAFLWIYRDVTERKAAEHERKRYERIFEGLNDGVYVLDAAGTFEYVNDSYAGMKGVDREDLLGTNIAEWVQPESVERAQAVREEIRAGKREYGAVELEFVVPEGENFPAELRIIHLEREDGRTERVGVIRDITERKERERRLERQTDRLEEFASIVSHDLRNPLNIAQSRLELARQGGENEHYAAIERALDRMEAIIGDTLTLAREGQSVAGPEPVAVTDLARRCWQMVESDGATLVADDPIRVRADSERLRHVLENLFRNAVEHGGTGADLTVRVGALPDGDGFYVADDGPGIPQDRRDEVFQAGHTTVREGTGFGLTIVERIVEAHGWTIDVTESESGGARFEISGVDPVE